MNLKFKYIAIKTSRILINIFHIVPIDHKKIVYISFGGKQKSCNPHYISKAIEQLYPGKYKQIWVKDKSTTQEFDGVDVCIHGTLAFIKDMMTAGCIVTNDTLPSYLNFSDGQLVINTWHGGGLFKQTFGLYSDNELKYNNAIQRIHNNDIKLYTLSGKSWHDNVVVRRFGYTGETLKSGMPRNDIFFLDRTKIIEKVKKHFSIPEDKKIVLYAPTFRGNPNHAVNGFDEMEIIDIPRLTSNLKNKFGHSYAFIFRGHHLMTKGLKECLNASNYPDMQELLAAADVFISDYSSCLWDYSLTKRPCFIFAPDFIEYSQNPGFESDYHKWPFSVSKSNDELERMIIDYNEEDYSIKCDQYHADYGSYEDGNASRRIAEYINNKLSCHNE